MLKAGEHLVGMLAQGTIETTLLLLGLVLVISALMMAAAKRRKRQGGSLTAREQMQRLDQTSGMRGDLEQLMVEIEQLAKRMGAQLDVKAMRLEQLLRQADQRVAELERLQRAEPGQASAPPAPRPQAPPAAPEDPLARNIYQLADAGNDSIEIARQLNEHVGKVELILALRRT
jgi:hypothetical protein